MIWDVFFFDKKQIKIEHVILTIIIIEINYKNLKIIKRNTKLNNNNIKNYSFMVRV